MLPPQTVIYKPLVCNAVLKRKICVCARQDSQTISINKIYIKQYRRREKNFCLARGAL